MSTIDRELKYCAHEEKLYTRIVQDTNVRNAILERNSRLRADMGRPLRDDTVMGRLALSIPEMDYWHLKRTRPELFEGDQESRQRALAQFMASPDSIPYRVR